MKIGLICLVAVIGIKKMLDYYIEKMKQTEESFAQREEVEQKKMEQKNA